MSMSLKMMAAAVGIVAVALPAFAEERSNTNPPVSENNVFWGTETAPARENAYGSVDRHQRTRVAPGAVAAPASRIIDCTHVAFPQCGGV